MRLKGWLSLVVQLVKFVKLYLERKVKVSKFTESGILKILVGE